MLSCRRFLLLMLFCLSAVQVYGQVRVDGSIYAMTYGWENRSEEQQWDLYQGLIFRVRPAAESGFSLKTNLRVARTGSPAAWGERIYNLYGDWSAPHNRLRARVGRQFLYRGVVNGSIDGVSLYAEPVRNLDVELIGGVAVPFTRPFEVASWEDARVLGAYSSYHFTRTSRVDVSFVDRSRAGVPVWQQAGTAVSVTPLRNLYFFGQFDYNLLKSTYQGMRYRLTYHPRSWSISAELNSQKPRIYEDSFFNVFELSAFNQVRGAVSYYLGRQYQLNLQYMHSRFEEGETANEAIVTVGRTRWGDVGLIVQTGFGGEHVGLFGNLNYSILNNLQFRLRSTYNSFTARTLSIGEEATAFALGFHYRPIPSLLFQTEVQRIDNTFFDRDVRALLRINYLFGRRRDPAVRTFL